MNILTAEEFGRLYRVTRSRAYEISRRPELVPPGVAIVHIGRQVRFVISPTDSANGNSQTANQGEIEAKG